MEEPFVTASRRRRKETSGGERPGCACDEERICDTRMGRPVRVERIRRVARCRWPVKRTSCGVSASAIAVEEYVSGGGRARGGASGMELFEILPRR
jgi:hypothetical protein